MAEVVDTEKLKQTWTGWSFDEISYEIEAGPLVEYAQACGTPRLPGRAELPGPLPRP